MRAMTRQEIEDLIRQAKKSERKRAMHALHTPQDVVQRMVNAIVPGSYIPPHKHQNPDKLKLFSILAGEVACLQFDVLGEVDAIYTLDAEGDTRLIDVPPRTYHTLIALKPSALLEIIQGPYDVTTHKRIAPWAPDEQSAKADDYRLHLQAIVDNWK